MQIRTESRTYSNTRNGKSVPYKVQYELEFKDSTLSNVRNELGFSIEKESECFEFFKSKFS